MCFKNRLLVIGVINEFNISSVLYYVEKHGLRMCFARCFYLLKTVFLTDKMSLLNFKNAVYTITLIGCSQMFLTSWQGHVMHDALPWCGKCTILLNVVWFVSGQLSGWKSLLGRILVFSCHDFSVAKSQTELLKKLLKYSNKHVFNGWISACLGFWACGPLLLRNSSELSVDMQSSACYAALLSHTSVYIWPTVIFKWISYITCILW